MLTRNDTRTIKDPLQKLEILANETMLNALQQAENAHMAFEENNQEDYQTYVANVWYLLGKHRAYMGMIEKQNFSLWMNMNKRDATNITKIKAKIQLGGNFI